jgi:hypothetical protein
MHLPLVDHWVDSWATTSQQRARRNAMVAATTLTQRRAEAREVADYLASRAAQSRLVRESAGL